VEPRTRGRHDDDEELAARADSEALATVRTVTSPGHVSLAPLLKRALNLTREASDQAMKVHGVTAAQYGVLQRLAAYPGSSGAELARMMLITPQAVHQLISTLEKLDYIERANDPNHGRIIRCVVTSQGHNILSKCRAAALDVERELSKPFAPGERDLLVYLLTKYSNRADSRIHPSGWAAHNHEPDSPSRAGNSKV
jgi:DNA-binding MarR family transcriptional regulator